MILDKLAIFSNKFWPICCWKSSVFPPPICKYWKKNREIPAQNCWSCWNLLTRPSDWLPRCWIYHKKTLRSVSDLSNHCWTWMILWKNAQICFRSTEKLPNQPKLQCKPLNEDLSNFCPKNVKSAENSWYVTKLSDSH